MKILFALIVIQGAIIKFNLKESYGQVIQDLSGNNNYGVLGSTLSTDSSDPILTDRGGYFTSSSYLSLPPNSLLPAKDLALTNFYGLFFIKVISSGTIFSLYNSNSVLIKLSHLSGNSINIYQFVSGSNTVFKSTALDLGSF